MKATAVETLAVLMPLTVRSEAHWARPKDGNVPERPGWGFIFNCDYVQHLNQ